LIDCLILPSALGLPSFSINLILRPLVLVPPSVISHSPRPAPLTSLLTSTNMDQLNPFYHRLPLAPELAALQNDSNAGHGQTIRTSTSWSDGARHDRQRGQDTAHVRGAHDRELELGRRRRRLGAERPNRSATRRRKQTATRRKIPPRRRGAVWASGRPRNACP
jgi:hypothetical protein